MPIASVMALICYISSNPSPQQWLVSGPAAAVGRMDATAATMPEVRRIAHAEDGDTGFSRYEMGANPPNRILWILLGQAGREQILYSSFQHVVRSCPSGERSDVGDRRSELVLALIGPAAAIRKLRLPPGVGEAPVRLEDGRTGIGFALRDDDRDHYDELVRRAAAGMLPGVDLALVKPKGLEQPAPAAPEPPDAAGKTPARTSLHHRGS